MIYHRRPYEARAIMEIFIERLWLLDIISTDVYWEAEWRAGQYVKYADDI